MVKSKDEGNLILHKDGSTSSVEAPPAPRKPSAIDSILAGVGRAIEKEDTQDRLIDVAIRKIERDLGVNEKQKRKEDKYKKGHAFRFNLWLRDFIPIAAILMALYIIFRVINAWIP